MGIRRPDFREVKPTEEEKAAWDKRYPRRKNSRPYRAEHIPCGRRIWYSGIGIGSHMRACPARKPKCPGCGGPVSEGAEPWCDRKDMHGMIASQ